MNSLLGLQLSQYTKTVKRMFFYFHNNSGSTLNITFILYFLFYNINIYITRWKIRKEIKVTTKTAAHHRHHRCRSLQAGDSSYKQKRSVLSNRGGFQSSELPETICLYETLRWCQEKVDRCGVEMLGHWK